MIRRDSPRGAEAPTHWLLITQREHARLSHALATAWDPSFVDTRVRDELLAAVLRHDDGWAAWEADPGIDPEHGRPYSFTEMPTDAVQRIWSDSIEACRAIGPLAGWVVAAHFSALQSKRDDDYPEWVDWLAGVDSRREIWLAEWLATSPHNPRELADRCLAWLQAFDWMSLWLCCRCPALHADGSVEPLTIGGDLDERLGWPTVRFTPKQPGVVAVAPWPFSKPMLDLRTTGRLLSVTGAAGAGELLAATEPVEVAWELRPE